MALKNYFAYLLWSLNFDVIKFNWNGYLLGEIMGTSSNETNPISVYKNTDDINPTDILDKIDIF